MAIRFIYFDLGGVLLDFDIERMLRQIGDRCGRSPEEVRAILYGAQLGPRFETGLLTLADFHAEFCRMLGTTCDLDTLTLAGSDIFTVRPSMLPLVGQLHRAGHRLGVLSNTADHHWRYVLGRYRFLEECFGVHALSFRLGAMKPDPKIYAAAQELAGCPAEEIFFCDDMAENVAGARAAGFDAVHYVGARQLVDELHRRGIRFNY